VVGELPEDSETCGSQDQRRVNLAGAGRKNGYLSREVCCAARLAGYRPSNGTGGRDRSQQRP